MNDLNAQQIILLTLFVSFVTSIATGITTVSLLEKTPEHVTQTINRVVEKTIERVVPNNEEDNSQSTVITPEKEIVTVVVNEEDLTVESVEKNSRSLARIYSVDNRSQERTFLSLGIVFDNTGRLITDSNLIQSKANNLIAIYQSGEFEMDVEYRELNNPYAILKVKNPGETQFSPATFGDSASVKLAQSVISLSGIESNTVSTGIITNLINQGESLGQIETSVNGNNVLVGSILLNLKGEIIGARISLDPNKKTTFLPANTISDFIKSQRVQ